MFKWEDVLQRDDDILHISKNNCWILLECSINTWLYLHVTIFILTFHNKHWKDWWGFWTLRTSDFWGSSGRPKAGKLLLNHYFMGLTLEIQWLRIHLAMESYGFILRLRFPHAMGPAHEPQHPATPKISLVVPDYLLPMQEFHGNAIGWVVRSNWLKFWSLQATTEPKSWVSRVLVKAGHYCIAGEPQGWEPPHCSCGPPLAMCTRKTRCSRNKVEKKREFSFSVLGPASITLTPASKSLTRGISNTHTVFQLAVFLSTRPSVCWHLLTFWCFWDQCRS